MFIYILSDTQYVLCKLYLCTYMYMYCPYCKYTYTYCVLLSDVRYIIIMISDLLQFMELVKQKQLYNNIFAL